MNPTTALTAAVLLLHTTAVARAASPELHFCTTEETKKILSTEDDFTRRLSPFDRAARLKSTEPVDQKTFLDFTAAEARDWTPELQRLVTTAYDSIRPALDTYDLPFPETVQLLTTTGVEEAGAAYSRGTTIVLPTGRVGGDATKLARLLAHELFHVLSRNAPELRHRLYEAIGFHRCNELILPKELKPIRITNPDAPVDDHTIELTYNDQKTWAVPVLFADPPRYDPSRGDAFFAYLQFQFLLVNFEKDSRTITPKRSDDGTPHLVPLNRLGGFHEQVGRNTGYIIHPEEILADNFADIITRKTDVPSPDIQTRLKHTLSKP